VQSHPGQGISSWRMEETGQLTTTVSLEKLGSSFRETKEGGNLRSKDFLAHELLVIGVSLEKRRGEGGRMNVNHRIHVLDSRTFFSSKRRQWIGYFWDSRKEAPKQQVIMLGTVPYDGCQRVRHLTKTTRDRETEQSKKMPETTRFGWWRKWVRQSDRTELPGQNHSHY